MVYGFRKLKTPGWGSFSSEVEVRSLTPPVRILVSIGKTLNPKWLPKAVYRCMNV